jgi:hypothetical protein
MNEIALTLVSPRRCRTVVELVARQELAPRVSVARVHRCAVRYQPARRDDIRLRDRSRALAADHPR